MLARKGTATEGSILPGTANTFTMIATLRLVCRWERTDDLINIKVAFEMCEESTPLEKSPCSTFLCLPVSISAAQMMRTEILCGTG
jgi:hypothetical protein